MRIIGLWNPEHHLGVTSNASNFLPNTTALNTNETTLATLLSASAIGTSWYWYTYNTLGRNWLRILCNISNTNTINYFTLCPALNASQYTELRAQGAKRVYYGLRVLAVNVKSGANLITVSGTGYYPISNGNVYYVEAVCNLENNTRTIYVNGVAVTIPVVNDLVAVGNYQMSIFNTSGQSLGFTDYYFAASEPSDDAALPVRLGKMTVGTALPVSTENDSKFKAVGRFGIVDTLKLTRPSQAPSTVTDYVESDSNGSKMSVMFAAPTAGNPILGAAIRVAGMRAPDAQAYARIDYGSGMKNISISQSNTTNAQIFHHPFPIDRPANGWSEAELNSLVVKLWSERSV